MKFFSDKREYESKIILEDKNLVLKTEFNIESPATGNIYCSSVEVTVENEPFWSISGEAATALQGWYNKDTKGVDDRKGFHALLVEKIDQAKTLSNAKTLLNEWKKSAEALK